MFRFAILILMHIIEGPKLDKKSFGPDRREILDGVPKYLTGYPIRRMPRRPLHWGSTERMTFGEDLTKHFPNLWVERKEQDHFACGGLQRAGPGRWQIRHFSRDYEKSRYDKPLRLTYHQKPNLCIANLRIHSGALDRMILLRRQR